MNKQNKWTPEVRAAYMRTYMKGYYKDNPDQHEKHKQQDRVRNKARPKNVENALASLRRARKLQATPKWANKDKIRTFYDQAVELTKQTGMLHVVDHIVPLRGHIGRKLHVCGLHVEGNLQILDWIGNQKKSNVCWPDMPA